MRSLIGSSTEKRPYGVNGKDFPPIIDGEVLVVTAFHTVPVYFSTWLLPAGL